MRPRVLLDADGVLINFHRSCLDLINKIGGTSHDLDGLCEWDLFKSLNVPEDVVAEVYRVMKEPGWCRELPIYPEAVDGVNALREIADVYVVTSPMNGPTWTHERDRSLMSHFNFTTKQIIHASAKYVCAGDVLVDDRISNLLKWKAAHPGGMAVFWMIPQYAHLAAEYQIGPSVCDWSLLRNLVGAHERDRRWQSPSAPPVM